jgi:hypothetical protein
MKEVGDNALLPTWRIFLPNREAFIHPNGGTLYLRDERGKQIDRVEYTTIGLEEK